MAWINALHSFWACILARLQHVVVFLQGTSDFCVSPDKFIVNQTKDFLSAGNLSLYVQTELQRYQFSVTDR